MGYFNKNIVRNEVIYSYFDEVKCVTDRYDHRINGKNHVIFTNDLDGPDDVIFYKHSGELRPKTHNLEIVQSHLSRNYPELDNLRYPLQERYEEENRIRRETRKRNAPGKVNNFRHRRISKKKTKRRKRKTKNNKNNNYLVGGKRKTKKIKKNKRSAKNQQNHYVNNLIK